MNSELDSGDIVLSDEELLSATVLVVDDEANIVILLETWLETIGCRVESAGDGEAGIIKATELLPDLILMDGMMPKMSGFDACQKLKENPLTRDIPVIFLTVQGEVQDVVKGLELGAHGYMTKPFKPQELLARVRSTLKIKQIQDRLRTHTDKLRQQWNWMHGVVESLPLGLLVFDPETSRVVYVNDRLVETLGLESVDEYSTTLAQDLQFFIGDRLAAEIWDPTKTLDQTYSLVLNEANIGEYRVRATSFEKNGKLGRQLLIEAPPT